MRIANFCHAARQEIAALGEEANHFRIGFARLAALLARGADDIEPAQGFGNVVCVAAVWINDLADLLRCATGLDPDIEVIFAVRRCGVDEAGTGIVGDVVACEERDVVRKNGSLRPPCQTDGTRSATGARVLKSYSDRRRTARSNLHYFRTRS